MHRGVLAIALAIACAGVCAAAKPFTAETIPGGTREAGEVKWSYELRRQAAADCRKSKPDNCVLNILWVRNESMRPIQCRLFLEQPRKDDKGWKYMGDEHVLFAGSEARIGLSHGPVALVPRKFEVECVAIPATPGPYSMTKECFGLAKGPSPESFYPPAAKRRQEEGNILIEYSFKRGSPFLHQVRVVDSSGFEDLDNAALELSKQVRVYDQCPEMRYRMKIRFVLADAV